MAEGLGRLPKIDLRPEGEPYVPPAKTSPLSDAATDHPAVQDSASTDGTEVTSSTSPPSAPDEDPIEEQRDPVVQETEPVEEQSPGDSHIVESSMLEEAMADSVITLQPHPPSTTSEKSFLSNQPQSAGSTSGADLILPIIIYAVVKSNPPQLASQLMYLRRYRSAICLTGEASYAIVNLTAVIEFLEHVELAELGLGHSSDKVIR